MQRMLVAKADGTSETVEAKKNTLLSTGSKPSNLPLLPSIKKNSLSIEALKLPEVLKHCNGGGVIGIELGYKFIYVLERKFWL
jgi:pyruvate/2-oxoglutarate dehydrogenase complex dihydrolipoamide dehydrogenase (E3) component